MLSLIFLIIIATIVNWPYHGGQGPWGGVATTLLVAVAMLSCVISAINSKSRMTAIASLAISSIALGVSLASQAPSSFPWIILGAILPARALADRRRDSCGPQNRDSRHGRIA